MTRANDGTGAYIYRGFRVKNHGYYPPDKCIWWEAVEGLTGEASFHAHTKREIKFLIDECINKAIDASTLK